MNMRIETRLLPRYLNSSIYHQSAMGDLEHELMRFPYGTHDDLIDAAQGLVQLLQFPKAKTAVREDEDAFKWWQRQSTKLSSPTKKTRIGQFKRRGRHPTIQSTESWR